MEQRERRHAAVEDEPAFVEVGFTLADKSGAVYSRCHKHPLVQVPVFCDHRRIGRAWICCGGDSSRPCFQAQPRYQSSPATFWGYPRSLPAGFTQGLWDAMRHVGPFCGEDRFGFYCGHAPGTGELLALDGRKYVPMALALTPSHGLIRKELLAANAYQPEDMP